MCYFFTHVSSVQSRNGDFPNTCPNCHIGTMLRLMMLSSGKNLQFITEIGCYYCITSTYDPEDKLMDHGSVMDFNLSVGSY